MPSCIITNKHITKGNDAMGMSASQARFLSLTARKNNVEFEGQQINQQRTCLSNESASYYSELCNMSVPTPPSIDDYTKVTYSFSDGAMTNTIMSILPDKDDKTKYNISYVESWQDDYAIVPSASSMVQKNADGTEFSIGGQKLRTLGTAPSEKVDEYYDSLTDDQKAKFIETEKYYLSMLQDKYGSTETFQVRYVKNTTTGSYEPQFFADAEVKNASKYNTKNLASVPCYALGSVTQSREVLGQSGRIEKDSSGRYVAITLELKDGNDKTVERTYNLTTTTTTDEGAYNDAMNQYTYKQHEYEHRIQEINSKLEIIQQQDKQLELKLKQLDTEENAISTELDAVKKVISKNVDSSFKTFG